jgi:transposase
MRGRWEFSDAQWQLIEPILRPRRRSDGRGRPWQDTRAVLNGVLWVLGTGAQGHRGAVARTAQKISAVPDLPSPFSTVGAGGQTGAHLARPGGGVAGPRKIAAGGGFHRRLLHWGEKGGLAVGPTKRGKGTKIIALADDHSLPLAVSIESASPHESQLVEGVLGHSFLDTLPARLIGDKAYDSDPLDRALAERYGIEMIAPHRGERREPTQDGRPLRRYRRRWRVERLFAWLHHFRRLVIRWEYHVENFFGMVI